MHPLKIYATPPPPPPPSSSSFRKMSLIGEFHRKRKNIKIMTLCTKLVLRIHSQLIVPRRSRAGSFRPVSVPPSLIPFSSPPPPSFPRLSKSSLTPTFLPVPFVVSCGGFALQAITPRRCAVVVVVVPLSPPLSCSPSARTLLLVHPGTEGVWDGWMDGWVDADAVTLPPPPSLFFLLC